ncbi:MAG: exodeoxyribonuclease V subunit alpha [Cyanobacteria bacterium K_Offshore_surface_m2_239]|nr:exodeoxyribonuclease V subunit alpha [Cyanobacteria bacterium K_Offshore_surface_m2_239]
MTSPPRRREPPPWLLPLSGALAEALPRIYGQPADPPLVELIEALTLALERGELTLNLRGPAPPGVHSSDWPDAHRAALAASPLARDPRGPLVVEDGRVGWRRWLQLRSAVLAALVARAARVAPAPATPAGDESLDPLQRQAIRTALERDLLVLAGGPGTGKTSTVAHLLEAAARDGDGAVIQLAAPTGKAAARLRAATGGRWPCGTLHQLLESRGDGTFRRHRQRPLSLDLLVVDEVSMVDLALMKALLDALPNQARLVLVGDPSQLPPVAPGAPLRDLLSAAHRPALAEAVVTLRTTWRNDGAIATMAAALRERIETAGDAPDPLDALRPLLRDLGADANLRWCQEAPGPLPAAVRQRLLDHLGRLRAAADACVPGGDQGWREVLAARDAFLLLTPRHRGPWGAHAVHRELLGEESAAALPRWPSGTPVICVRNLHDAGLSNGDLGVLVAREGERWLLFGQEEPLWIHPARVSGALEPALALTVHKAQGSESHEVMVLLPGPDPVDPRLLYTALTRARQRAWLFTPPDPGAATPPSPEMPRQRSGLPQRRRKAAKEVI